MSESATILSSLASSLRSSDDQSYDKAENYSSFVENTTFLSLSTNTTEDMAVNNMTKMMMPLDTDMVQNYSMLEQWSNSSDILAQINYKDNLTWVMASNDTAAAVNGSLYDLSSTISSLVTDSNVTVVNENVEKVYWAIALLFLPVLTIFGNILVILSVYREKGLQTATNYFIVSLAFADLLVAITVMPFAVYILVNVDWELSETVCDMYIAVDVTCSTASIFNLVAISIDRFIAVTQPIKYSKHKGNITRVRITITVVWVVSAVIASPIILGLNNSPERMPNLCVFYNSDFIIYSSLGSFYIPCIVMLFLYYQIFRAIRRRTKKSAAIKKPKLHDIKSNTVIENTPQISKLQEETTLSSMPMTQNVSVVEMEQSTRAAGSGSHEDEDDEDDDEEENELCKDGKSVDTCHIIPNKGQNSVDVSDQNALSHKGEPKAEVKDNGVASQNAAKELLTVKNIAKAQTGGTAAAIDKKKKKSRFALSMVHKSSRKKKRDKGTSRKERKATKTLAIVLGIFLLCWVPFFTCNVINAICMKLEIEAFQSNVELFMATTWLGYINSCLNPLIYTIFNNEFRIAFKKLLQSLCR